jgi:hypothetical protein
MPGTWLIRIGRWMSRKETFERMVAPAIADMQAEAAFGTIRRWRHYAGIGLVFVHAVLQDLRLDLTSAFDADARRMVWKRTAIWYVGVVGLLTVLGLRYNLPSDLPMDGLWSAALTSTGLEAVVTGASISTVVAVLYLCRKPSSRRSIALTVFIIGTLTSTFALAVRPLRMSADDELFHGIDHNKPGDLDARVAWSKDLHSGVSVLPSALMGIVLARRRGWRVARAVIGLFATWQLVVILLLYLGRSGPVPDLAIQYWRQIAINSVVAVIWLMFDELARRLRHAGPILPERR